jgi:hypothetical protein
LITTKIEERDLDSTVSSPEDSWSKYSNSLRHTLANENLLRACLIVLKSHGQFDRNNKNDLSNGVNMMDEQ